LILVDNAGDLTARFDDPRIKVFRHADRASASYARNRGVEHAEGELVCFFDDDDVMFPDYLESFITALREHPQSSMVRCGMQVGERENYSFATPECCLRREFATPTWDDQGPCQDQRYFKRIVAQNRWQEKRGDIVVIRRTLCRALRAPAGGLRSGKH
jgi:glycosyltransferase involved in cell wall biosynthesis